MTGHPDDPWRDSWVEQIAQFDEALRLGRDPAREASADTQLAQTQQFLLLLQNVWPRSAKKIGPYPLIRSLGQGVIGPSYLVEDPVNKEPLVLKILWPELSAHEETRRQFLQVAASVQRLKHAGIAAVRDARGAGPLCIVVSEHCPGISLAHWRRSKPQPIAWEVAAGLIAQLADILDFAHREGIAHGNLKPSNIFLVHEAEITPGNLHEATLRIGDFALAKAVQETRLTSQGGLAWPLPQFLAPEQLQHRMKPAEAACDLYALGVMWYDLVTGRCPIKGTTRAEVVAQLRDAAVPPPRQYRPEVPAAIESLVLQCLQRKPRNRPESARQLVEALRGLLPVSAVPAARPAWWKKLLGWK